jgi:arginine decarboxylase
MKLQYRSSLNYKFEKFDQFSLHLHTPAHQGVGSQKFLAKDLLYLDAPYITRCDLKPLEEKAKFYYNTQHTFALTGGASQGVVAALLMLGRKHRRVWVQRNCHKSVISGLILSGIEPIFFVPRGRVLCLQDLEQLFTEKPLDCPTCIILTNPTYEGWGYNVQDCISFCHNQGITVIVDEAHGSLWPASPILPQSALEASADLVVHSLHKYCGSVVQSALTHLPIGSSISAEEYDSALELVETTSKSNLILLSLEETIETIFAPTFSDCLTTRLSKLNQLRAQITSTDGILQLLTSADGINDPFKFFITSRFVTSEQLVNFFAEAGVDYELYDAAGVLFIFSVYHTDSELQLFENALMDVTEQIRKAKLELLNQIPACQYNQPQMRLLPRSAHFHVGGYEMIAISQADGRIAAEMVASCPPGWPLVIPGELLGDWHVNALGADFMIKVIKDESL